MTCFFCKGKMISATTTYMTESDGCVLVIKNVPCLKCTQCGETVFDGTTIKQIEKLTNALGAPVTEVAVLNYNNVVA